MIILIVLPDQSLPSVWEEYHQLRRRQLANAHTQTWGERRQHFHWVNDIDYWYGSNDRYHLKVHLVVCEEQWQAVNADDEIVTRTSRHVWLSNRPLNARHVHQRCNLGARHRWGIETGFLVEKHQGYQYEHCFAQDWNAMKGYHYLMRMAHALNVLARFSHVLKAFFQQQGVRGFIEFLRETLSGPWLKPEVIRPQLNRPCQLRLE